MKRNADHSLLDYAKRGKNDEFYTQMVDIERELVHYKESLRGKTIFCNCDDPMSSNFFRYFVREFHSIGLRKVIAACCISPNADLFTTFRPGYYYEYNGKGRVSPTRDEVKYFNGDGDFRSAESVALLEKSDVVITNPPFSLFREFVSLLVKHDKKFLIIGNINAITYKEIFGLIKANEAWMGINMGRGISGFIVPEHYALYGQETRITDSGERIVSPNNCMWLTNIDLAKRHEPIPLTKQYAGHEEDYPRFDNCDAININRTQDIPSDYHGLMGVPVTFLHKFNPEQFKIIKFRKGDDEKDLRINGTPTYFRVLIKRR